MKKLQVKVAEFNGVRNQFTIDTADGRYFQSYQTVIAFVDNTGQIYLDDKWNCSRTTSKHRSAFLGESTKYTQQKVDDGTYIVINLN